MAIEDAVVLAESIRDGGHRSIESALRRYETIRHRRTRSIVFESRAMGRAFQVDGAVLTGLRDTLTRLTPDALLRWNVERHIRSWFDLP